MKYRPFTIPQRDMKPELQSKAFKGECKEESCVNKRRSGSAYCQACSDNFKNNHEKK